MDISEFSELVIRDNVEVTVNQKDLKNIISFAVGMHDHVMPITCCFQGTGYPLVVSCSPDEEFLSCVFVIATIHDEKEESVKDTTYHGMVKASPKKRQGYREISEKQTKKPKVTVERKDRKSFGVALSINSREDWQTHTTAGEKPPFRESEDFEEIPASPPRNTNAPRSLFQDLIFAGDTDDFDSIPATPKLKRKW